MSDAPARTRSYRQVRRAQAMEDTRRRIVETFAGLLRNRLGAAIAAGARSFSFDTITLKDAADGAGVTVQTVIRHFEGKEGLIDAAAEIMLASFLARRDALDHDLDGVIEHLVGGYEEVGDIVVQCQGEETRYPVLGPLLALGRDAHRDWIRTCFGGRLAELPAERRALCLDALAAATDVSIWKLMRRDMSMDRAAVVEAMRLSVTGVLYGANAGKGELSPVRNVG